MALADSYGLFWNSNSGDRKYNAESFEKWLRKFFTSGVFEGDLEVLASSGMTIAVQTGYANLFGKVGLFETVTNITLSTPNSTYPRIDTIVVERNDADREIVLKSITGAYSGDSPQPTAPVWSEANGIYQLVLAQIYVGAGVSAITQADITDTRMDSDLCGYITGTVEEIDFSQITAQFEAFLADFEEENLDEFENWFQRMKDQLSTDAAGHLQAEIDDIDGDITAINSALSSKYGTSDTAETTLADNDYVPFYDTSASGARKTLWSNIKSVLKTYFDTLYATTTTVTNKHKVTRKTVNTSSWSTDTTSQSGSTLYKKSISLSHVYVDCPSVEISTSSGTGLPTTAQQTAYDLLQYVTIDGTTMYLYASAVPSNTFYIQIEGVD